MSLTAHKTDYDTLTTNLPERGTREWYRAKRARKLGRFKGGGKAAKFREISRFKPVSIHTVLYGALPKVYISEYYFYLWNMGSLLCVYCYRKLTKRNKTQDHVVPRAHGGRSVPENLMPCCQDCNWQKADKSLLMYLAERAEV